MKYLQLLLILTLINACHSETPQDRINRIHNESLTIDTHSDTPLNLLDSTFKLAERHNGRESGTRCDFPRMKEGGLDAMFFAVFVGQKARTPEGNQKAKNKALTIFKRTKEALKQNPDLAILAKEPEDAYRIEKEGKRAIYLGIENGYVIGQDLSMIETFYKMGARYITLCHTKNNDICDSANDTLEHGGLSPFGEKVVLEMNKLGMLIDVSHISENSFFDVIKLSKTPVIASHSCAKAICDNPRNLSDEQLIALKENGGVVQMCILSDYVKTPEANPARDSAFTELRTRFNNFNFVNESEEEAAWEEWRRINKTIPAKLAHVSDMVDHIDHIVKLIGIDYVGIGTDFDGGGGLEDCFDVSELKNITAELVHRNYSDEDIRKIWGENFMRVFNSAS